MTPAELKEIIASSENREWFKLIEETFNFPSINISFKLKGVSAIYEYVCMQIKGWDDILKEENIKIFNNSKKYFDVLRKEIIDFVNTPNSLRNNRIDTIWNSKISPFINNSGNIFTYDCPETEFFRNVYKHNPLSVLGAYGFIVGSIDANQLSAKNYFTGLLLANEFTLKNKEKIVSKNDAEIVSFDKMQNDFKKHLSECEEQLIRHLHNSNKNFEEHAKKIDDLKTIKETNFTDWFINSKNNIETFDLETKTKIKELETLYNEKLDTSEAKIKELESLYIEKLKLSAPAEFWKNRGADLQTKGHWSLLLLVVLVLIVSGSLALLLWQVPEEIYKSFFNEDKSAAIRWSIIYITFISFMAYCIRAITKLMFSSYHLARDCQERYTLTYFYLALLKDTEITKEDRQLIMQSLFSRAETGLLKDDSTPSMPNDIVNKFFSKE